MMSIARAFGPKLIWICVAASLAAPAFAQSATRGDQPLLASADGRVRVDALPDTSSPRGDNRGVQTCVDITGINGWDGLDDPDNVVIEVDISDQLKVVGIAWDVGIASVGESWLSDASVLLSNSDGSGDPNAAILAPGFNVQAPGNREFSSNGVVMFADAGLADVEPNADGLVRLQIYEAFDDVPDQIDSAWRNAASPVTCPGIWLELDNLGNPGGPGMGPDIDPNAVPLDRPLTLALLMLLLATVGIRFLSNRA